MDRMLKVFLKLKLVMAEFIDVFMMYIIMITPYATSRMESVSIWKSVALLLVAHTLNEVAGRRVDHLAYIVEDRKETEAMLKRIADKRLAN